MNIYNDDEDDQINTYTNNPMNEKSKKSSDIILNSNSYSGKKEKIDANMVDDRNVKYEIEEYGSDDDDYSFIDEDEEENENEEKKEKKKEEKKKIENNNGNSVDDISSFYPTEKKGEIYAESEVQGLGAGKKKIENTFNPM